MTRTVGELLAQTVRAHGDVVALHDPRPQPPVSVRYADLVGQVRLFSAGLLAMGIAAGERVGLISDNGPRWILSDLSLLCMGAVTVPRGADTSADELLFILGHCGAAAVLIQDADILEQLASRLERLEWLRLVVVLDDSLPAGAPAGRVRMANYSAVIELGAQQPAERIDRQYARVQPSDIATIVYTSGTTGVPKGVMLSHANIVSQADLIDLGLEIKPGHVVLSFLPAWHAYERVVEYLMLRHAATITYSDKRRLRSDMATIRPHLLPCVPRMWESIYSAIHDKLRKRPPVVRRVIALCLAASHRFVLARRLARGTAARPRPSPWSERALEAVRAILLWPVHAIADTLVYRPIRHVTGGRLLTAVSGGGSLPPYLDDFYEAVGIPILNGYGLTETSPVLANRRLNRNVRGSVGPPVAETELRVRNEAGIDLPQGETGVIWARGPQVMRGYYRNGEETRKCMTAAGWFNTGDLGWITHTGDLVITGRAKDVIVLSSGENIDPERIESVALQSPLIRQIMVVGQDRNTPGALVVPDIQRLAAQMGMPQDFDRAALLHNPRAVRMVRNAIASTMAADGRLAAYEQINRIALLDEEFTEENGMLTQTLKMRRNVIARRYANVIERLYSRRNAG